MTKIEFWRKQRIKNAVQKQEEEDEEEEEEEEEEEDKEEKQHLLSKRANSKEG